jgi:DtxR family Mn-dependent transcriptional regulator
MRLAALTERVRLEDAVKHLHDCDYRGQPASVESVAGALEVTRARAVGFVARLEALGLVRTSAERVVLTSVGRAEALRLLRSHRLWERYLADRTGLGPAEWHDEAERLEHRLSPTKVEALASSMGHPVYDPHGDPIPTAAGKLPPRAGFAVTALRPGQAASIVHLEDEPRAVFEQLVAAGLAPGMQVQLLDASAERVRLLADGRVHALEPVIATNITVAPTEGLPEPAGPFETLADLETGDRVVVRDIAPVCQGPQRRRLLDLGLVPGTEVAVEFRGPLGEPIAYRIRGAVIALRREQAELVRIERDGASVEAAT